MSPWIHTRACISIHVFLLEWHLLRPFSTLDRHDTARHSSSDLLYRWHIGTSEKEHLCNLAEVFKQLEKHGFRPKKPQCSFMAKSVEYLGHQVDRHGIWALPNKVEAITNAPSPKNVQKLWSFLVVLICSKPLKHLLPSQSAAERQAKVGMEQGMCSRFPVSQRSTGLCKCADTLWPITMLADASAYGSGAVISHTFPDGSERPISFASRTLTPSEQNYAQLEKESLSLVYGIISICTVDHSPLLLTTSPWRQFSAQRKESPLWL